MSVIEPNNLRKFKDLEYRSSFIVASELKYPEAIQVILIKISDQPWLVRMPSSAGYSKHEAQFNALAANTPNIGFHISPETPVILLK
jgi:hypothetical protein